MPPFRVVVRIGVFQVTRLFLGTAMPPFRVVVPGPIPSQPVTAVYVSSQPLWVQSQNDPWDMVTVTSSSLPRPSHRFLLCSA
jgi:hypothetical protein